MTVHHEYEFLYSSGIRSSTDLVDIRWGWRCVSRHQLWDHAFQNQDSVPERCAGHTTLLKKTFFYGVLFLPSWKEECDVKH